MEKIHIESCPVQDLRPLKGIKDVTIVDVSNTKQFHLLGNHTRLCLHGYSKVNSFPKFDNVKYLNIASCEKFNNVDEYTYNSYYGLRFRDCRSVSCIPSLPNLVELVLIIS